MLLIISQLYFELSVFSYYIYVYNKNM